MSISQGLFLYVFLIRYILLGAFWSRFSFPFNAGFPFFLVPQYPRIIDFFFFLHGVPGQTGLSEVPE